MPVISTADRTASRDWCRNSSALPPCPAEANNGSGSSANASVLPDDSPDNRPGTDGVASRVDVHTKPEAFAALADEWDALAERCGGGLLYRHRFLQLWCEHFAPGETLRVLTLRTATGLLTAALPLLLRRTLIYGVPVRELCAMANVHSGRFDLLADNPPEAARAFLGLLLEQADWDVLKLIDVPQGGRAEALVDAAGAAGLRSGRWPSMNSPYIDLPVSWSEMEQTLSSRFRANMRRRWRRVAELGVVSTDLCDGSDPAILRARLDEGLQLEAKGWKGRGGTAICQASDTLEFYTALARQAGSDGRLRLWFLRLDGQAIAFQYGLQDGSRYLLLKPAYDEAHGSVAPGHLLIEKVLQDCITRGLLQFDFLGPDMLWKRDWASRHRPHGWLYLFRGPRGRMVHGLKFRMAPMVKALLPGRKRRTLQ
jgi:CelD/BcsL family acetyltransferase involved in cellulose biosynthesis